MESLELWQTLAFACVLFAFFVYSILDGFDLGLGILMPFIARDERERMSLFKAIAPFWDGNEVWLVIGSSALFASFPKAYSTLLPAFYLPFLFVILCFMCRIVSLELSYATGKVAKHFAAIFSISSLLASVAGLLAVGFIVAGLSTDGEGGFKLDIACLLRPLPYVLAAAFMLLMLLHTVSYLVWKVDGALKERMTHVAKHLWSVFAILFIASAVLLVRNEPAIWSKPLFWLGAAFTAGGALAFRLMLAPAREKWLFAITATAMAGLWLIAAGALFPNIVNSVHGDALITVHNSSSPLNTLKITVGAAVAGSVLIIGYTGFVYWVLGRKQAAKAN